MESTSEGIPWCWQYVSLVIVNPLIGGLVCNYIWGPLSLHWAQNSWAPWRLGAITMLVIQLRTPAVNLLVRFGLVVGLAFAFISVLVMLPSLFFFDEEWAAAVLTVCLAFEAFVLYDAVAFVTFGDSEFKAQQASTHVLQYFTLSSALAPTFGGLIYSLLGWQGIAAVGAGLKTVQCLVLVSSDAVLGQLLLWRYGADSDDFEVGDDLEMDKLEDVVPSIVIQRTMGRKSVADVEETYDTQLPGVPSESPIQVEGWHSPTSRRGSIRSGNAEEASESPSRVKGRSPKRLFLEQPAPDPISRRGSLRSGTTKVSRKSKVTRATAQTMNSRWSGVTGMSQKSAVRLAFGQVDAPVVPMLQYMQSNLSNLEDDGLEEEEQAAVIIPGYIKGPLLAIFACSFGGMFAVSMSTITAAVVFQEIFGLSAATSGLFRSAGGLAAVLTFALMPKSASDEARFERGGLWRLLAPVLCKPYRLAAILALWSTLCVAMMMPSVYVAASAQVLIGLGQALTNRAVTDMCLFFSLGDAPLFLKIQVYRTFSDAMGGGIACLLGPMVYDVYGVQGPFVVGAALTSFVFVTYICGFILRSGCGSSLEDAESARASKRGIDRVSKWQRT